MKELKLGWLKAFINYNFIYTFFSLAKPSEAQAQLQHEWNIKYHKSAFEACCMKYFSKRWKQIALMYKCMYM